MSSSLSSAHSNISGLDIVATHLLRSREHADRPKSRTRSVKILKSNFRILFLVVLSLLLPATIAAQTHRASVRGTIFDPRQAAIPGASVSITRLETGEVRTTTANGEGEYAISSLPAGSYEIKVESTGFTPYVKSIELLVNQERRLDVELVVPGPGD